jgi:serine/threonine protein kinase
VGTPGYIAPELLAHHSFDYKIDIYSCGIVLYFMLTGSSPFTASTINKILELNNKNKIHFSKYPWVSKDAQEFILKLTNTNPYFRPNATEALHDKWLTKNTNLVKAKDIVKESKLDSYSFYKHLAREIPNEFTDSMNSPLPNPVVMWRRIYGVMVKVNKIPDFETNQTRLSCDREELLKIAQKLPKRISDNPSFYKFVDNNLKKRSDEDSSSLNRISDSTSSDISKVRAKSTFALKVQSNDGNVVVE